MFADAGVYGLALYAVGRHARHQLRAARLSGWLQLLLALGALAEVLRRALFGSEPEPLSMMSIGFLALCAEGKMAPRLDPCATAALRPYLRANFGVAGPSGFAGAPASTETTCGLRVPAGR